MPALIPELSIRDLPRSLAFYRHLGFRVLYDRPEEGFARLALGTAEIMLDQIGIDRDFDTGLGALPGALGRGMNLQIEVDDITPLLAALSKAGHPLHLQPETRWYRAGATELGNRQFIVADPDGYLLRFFQDLGTRPAGQTDAP
jgi:catechol 2,3-dioxygenase-like lactoylglutathione lyase family enzyme